MQTQLSYILPNITKTDVWVFLLLVGIYILILRIKIVPSASAVQDFVTVLNTKGGIILTLSFLSLVFFSVTIFMFYTIIQDLKAGTLKVDNGIALMGLQFCMNSAFSLCLGALLKTMTGEIPVDKSITTTTETTSKSTIPKQPEIPPQATVPTPTSTTSTTTDAAKTVVDANKTVADINSSTPPSI